MIKEHEIIELKKVTRELGESGSGEGVHFLQQFFTEQSAEQVQIVFHVHVDMLDKAFRAVISDVAGVQPAFGIDYDGDEWKLYVDYYFECHEEVGYKERLEAVGLFTTNENERELEPAQVLLQKVFHAEGKDVLIGAFASEHDRRMVRIVMPYEHYRNAVLPLVA